MCLRTGQWDKKENQLGDGRRHFFLLGKAKEPTSLLCLAVGCYGLNFCIPETCLKFIYWIPNLQCIGKWVLWEVIRYRWGHEDGIFMMDEFPYRKGPGSLFSLGHVRIQLEGSYMPGRRPSPESDHAGTLTLNFLVSRTVKNKCLLSKPPSLRYRRTLFYWALFYCTSQILGFSSFLQIEGLWQPASSKSIGVIFSNSRNTSCFCVSIFKQ